MSKTLLYIVLLAIAIVAPFALPDYKTQLATLWLMIIVALTWDMTGGQMGYNSLGNIFFYGTGMYVAAVVGISMEYNLGDYTAASGGGIYKFSPANYFGGLFLGSLAAGVFCAVCAVIIGALTFGLRGPYFAIGTLGVAVAAGELVSNWDWLGGGQGISLPVYPYDYGQGKTVFYFIFMAVGVGLFAFLAWLYSTRFGSAINAIRDDEEKADAIGMNTLRYKLFTWAIAAFFVGIAGAVSGYQLIHFEPLETAYQDRVSRHIHDRLRSSGRQGHAVGAGYRGRRVSRIQGSDLELPSGLAMGCARRPDHRDHRLFPGGHRRLGPAQETGMVRHRGR